MNNLTKRILSAITLAPLVLYIIYIGGLAYQIMIVIACLIMLWEWFRITKSSQRKWAWQIAGIIYIIPPCLLLILMGADNFLGRHGSIAILIPIIIVTLWAVDISAYLFGKIIGGYKIAPKISPNKTWAGLAGGIIGAIVTLYFALPYFDSGVDLTAIIVTGGFCAIIAQIGDFFESWVKRNFNAKDSSNIIPGHGGLLDRLDGLLAVMWGAGIYFLFILYLISGLNFD